MVGLGDVARKAYLPVLAVRPDIELHLVTRNARVLAESGKRWRISELHPDISTALGTARFDAAFVHAATGAHPALVAELLAAGVAVLVDKPLADDLAGAERLAELAARTGTPLAVGFNRRHAPVHAELLDRPRSVVRMAKDRRGPPHPARRTVFDDFIHVVDTIRFLSPVPVRVAAIETVGRDGLLEAALLVLSGDGFHATGAMHRAAGMDAERLEVMGDGMTVSVRDMAEVRVSDGVERRTRRGDWTPVADQRGFTAMCDAFLRTVREGRAVPLDDMLETHRICERVVAHAEGSYGTI